MNFSTNGFEEEEKEFASPYIRPGVHEAKVKSIEYFESSKKGTPGIKFTFEGRKVGEQLDGPVAETSLWLSEKAWEYTQRTLTRMASAFDTREALDAVEVDGAKEYVEAITPHIVGIWARFLFIGEEVEGRDGKNNWFKATLPFYAQIEGLEVTQEESKITFNEEKHLEKLPEPTEEDMVATSTTDDLPF